MVGGIAFLRGLAAAQDECRFVEGGAPALLSADSLPEPVQVNDRLVMGFGSAGGKKTALAGFNLPPDLDLNGRSLDVAPGLFTHANDESKRIPPEVFEGFATVSGDFVLVRLCADAVDIGQGTYEGQVVVGGFAVMDALVTKTSWLVLLGLPLAIGPAAVAVAALDSKEHTRYLFLVALAGALLAWFTFRSNETLNSAGDLAAMLGVEFAGASGFLLGLKALWPSSSAASSAEDSD